MTYVVTGACEGCKYTDCVVVCPVECFHDGANMVAIDPEECICCGACMPECPVEAILHVDNVSDSQRRYIDLNAKMARNCPPIVTKKPPLADAG